MSDNSTAQPRLDEKLPQQVLVEEALRGNHDAKDGKLTFAGKPGRSTRSLVADIDQGKEDHSKAEWSAPI